MNYREWLLYRAQQFAMADAEPEIFRYTAWQNYRSLRDWYRRADAAHLLKSTGAGHLASMPPS